jgi:hypothetical protein
MNSSTVLCLCHLQPPRFANLGQKVILQGLGGGNGSRTAAVVDPIGELFDDGKREHDDRYAGDGLYSNTILIQFDKTDVPVYKEFYVSQLEKLLSSTIEIAGAALSTCFMLACARCLT